MVASYNPNKPSERTKEELKASIAEFGFLEPIILNLRTKTIIGGHTRLAIAEELKLKEVPVLEVDLDPTDERMANLGLNNIRDPWDAEKLEALFKELDISDEQKMKVTGFDASEVQEIVSLIHGADKEDPDFPQVVLKVARQDKKIIQEALRAAKARGKFTEYADNQNGNGNALARICEDFIKNLEVVE
jgi:ParB-like chromosome segregation protein Spo0J